MQERSGFFGSWLSPDSLSVRVNVYESKSVWKTECYSPSELMDEFTEDTGLVEQHTTAQRQEQAVLIKAEEGQASWSTS